MVLIDWTIFLIYRWFVLPLAIGFLKIFSFILPSKMQELVEDRSFQNLQHLPAKPIWLHASSGEIEYAKSVIRSLKEEFPQIPILVTYFSPSAKKLIQKFPGIDLAIALPWDRPADLDRFLDFYKPRTCLIARTDVWPEMAVRLKKRDIPSVLFAATYTSQSSRSGILSSALTRTALNSLTQIFCVSFEDKSNLQSLGIKSPCEVAGDTRFDQVLHRLSHPLSVKRELQPARHEKILICGSTWPQDEEVLLAVLPKWVAQGGRVVIAPHEVGFEKIQALTAQMESLHLSVQTYSHSTSWTAQVLLVDQVGCLQELYAWGHLAFVGGSFKDKVHSVMEPLCVGIPVCVGPHHENNREALQFQHVVLAPGFFAVNVVQNAQDLELVMEKSLHLQIPEPAIQQKVASVSGATKKLTGWLKRSLNLEP